MLTKKEFRLSIRALGNLRPEGSLSMTGFILDSEQYRNASTIMAFYGVGSEPDTVPLLNRILRDGKRLCLPMTYAGGIMDARLVTSLDGLVESRYGIPEPSADFPIVPADEIDLILVPGLSFDLLGFRMGHGAGYYDRYLSNFNGQTIGLCFESRLCNNVPRDEYDLPVEYIATESRFIRCNR
ncbi:MAG: 5-formyltetrahydrofolate cyclo-ligase [Ruminococcaceae bacterium]|nr:5-formyltetrahydrofolate cyclo-ligase [Oscillospiraceae bacterium]